MNWGKKKILIVYSNSLFPTVMGSQVRVLSLIKELSRKHSIYFISQIEEKNQLKYQDRLSKYCKDVKLILSPNKESLVKGAIYKLIFYLFVIFKRYNSYYFYASLRKFRNAVIQFINSNNFDIIQVEYWFASGFLGGINRKPYLVLDTHDLLYEKSKLMIDSLPNNFVKKWKLYLWKWERQKETEICHKYHLLIAISTTDGCKFRNLLPHKNILVIPMGIDASFFRSMPTLREKNTIILYGAMGGKANIDAVLYLWNDILPIIRAQIGIKLIIIGSNPSEKVKKLAKNDWVEVTGYVEDVRKYIARGSVMILPLRLGGGFRSRVCEAMGMEIPVVGTHNALDSIECTHKENAIVSDDPKELAKWTIKILQHDQLREKIGKNGRKLIMRKFSQEVIYNELSEFYSRLEGV